MRRKNNLTPVAYVFGGALALFWPFLVDNQNGKVPGWDWAIAIVWWVVLIFLWRIFRKRLPRRKTIPVKRRPSRRIPNDVMAAVMRRDMGVCRNCGSGYDIQFDHIYPWSLGGPSTVDNIQLLCGTCNRRKSNKLIRR